MLNEWLNFTSRIKAMFNLRAFLSGLDNTLIYSGVTRYEEEEVLRVILHYFP